MSCCARAGGRKDRTRGREQREKSEQRKRRKQHKERQDPVKFSRARPESAPMHIPPSRSVAGEMACNASTRSSQTQTRQRTFSSRLAASSSCPSLQNENRIKFSPICAGDRACVHAFKESAKSGKSQRRTKSSSASKREEERARTWEFWSE